MPTHLEIVARLKQESALSSLGSASTAELGEYAAALCTPNAFGEFGDRQFPQICETVHIHLLRAHITDLQKHVANLHGHITNLNTSNTKIQKLVVVLTVASLFGAGGQIWFAYKADKKSEQTSPPVAVQPQTPNPQSSAPIPVANPSSGQTTKKQP
jgi:hypothetical protein